MASRDACPGKRIRSIKLLAYDSFGPRACRSHSKRKGVSENSPLKAWSQQRPGDVRAHVETFRRRQSLQLFIALGDPQRLVHVRPDRQNRLRKSRAKGNV